MGQNFAPIVETYCRLEFPDDLSTVFEFRGFYVNNYTIACDVPSPAIYPEASSSIAVPLLLSFNQQQQYCTPITFYYSSQDTILQIYPTKQYVDGNAMIKATYVYFFDAGYKNAVCKFTYTDEADGQVYSTQMEIIEWSKEEMWV